MIVCLKGVPEPVEIPTTSPIGIAHYPHRTDDPVQEHFAHWFVQYQGSWAEISLKTFNSLAAAGNPQQNV